MSARKTIDLPFSNGSVKANANGTIEIGGSTGTITVYPFAQPTPYFTVGVSAQPITTDGGRLLTQAVGNTAEQVRVRAGYQLLAALLISLEYVQLSDLSTMTYAIREDSLTFKVTEERWGLPAGSEIVFRDDTHLNKLTIEPLTTSYLYPPLPSDRRTHGI